MLFRSVYKGTIEFKFTATGSWTHQFFVSVIPVVVEFTAEGSASSKISGELDLNKELSESF